MTELTIKLPKELQTKAASQLLGKALIEMIKQDISKRYKETGEVTDEDWEFCEHIDWHPVDELPQKPEHIEELKRRMKEETGKVYHSTDEFFNDLDAKK